MRIKQGVGVVLLRDTDFDVHSALLKMLLPMSQIIFISRVGVAKFSTRVKHKDGITFRSKFEASVYNVARASKKKLDFEPKSAIISYITSHRYQPDFALPNGVLVECKGHLDVADRSKMVAVKKQRPELDIRFVFMNPRMRLSKHGKTYGEWADSAGFPWAEGIIPLQWWKEGKTNEQQEQESDDD